MKTKNILLVTLVIIILYGVWDNYKHQNEFKKQLKPINEQNDSLKKANSYLKISVDSLKKSAVVKVDKADEIEKEKVEIVKQADVWKDKYAKLLHEILTTPEDSLVNFVERERVLVKENTLVRDALKKCDSASTIKSLAIVDLQKGMKSQEDINLNNLLRIENHEVKENLYKAELTKVKFKFLGIGGVAGFLLALLIFV